MGLGIGVTALTDLVVKAMKLPGMSGTVEQHMVTDVGEDSLVEK